MVWWVEETRTGSNRKGLYRIVEALLIVCSWYVLTQCIYQFGQAGYTTGGVWFMDDPFGGSLINNRNCHLKCSYGSFFILFSLFFSLFSLFLFLIFFHFILFKLLEIFSTWFCDHFFSCFFIKKEISASSKILFLNQIP